MAAEPSPAPPLAGPADPQNAFTVDLEEWFHVCGVEPLRFERWTTLPSRVEPTTRWLLDALDRANVCATFFIVGWVAERFPELVEAVRDAGHEIGSHGHAHRRVYELDAEAFRRDLQASVRALKAAGAGDVSLFRAPEWSVNDRSLWALAVLVEEGFRLDASMAPLTMVGSLSSPRYPHVRQTAAGPIVEVPPLVADRFGRVMPLGWGWGLRMSSPRRVLDAIERVNRRGQPAVLTVHPWEIDPDPPRVRLPARLHFAHYFRIGGFADRLRTILSGGHFGPIGRIAPAAPAGA
ncbi:MAG: polysaccharide deacetylase family protein [Acidobacteria bacterium]|nr:MAG: polysaccharide deacetylase family protein [Acidobacteriota bacterium]